MKYYFETELTRETYHRLKDIESSGVIHSIYNHTFNILIDDQHLLTLADSTLNNGPNCIRLKGLDVSKLDLKETDRLTFKDNQIIHNNKFVVDYNDPIILDYKSLAYPKSLHHLDLKIKQLQAIDWYQRKLDLIKKDLISISTYNRFDDYMNLMLEASAKDDLSTIQKTLKKLVGLGIGLTPSGDDFLSGFAYITSLKNYPKPKVYEVLLDLEQYVKEHTNIISYSQYKMALQSEVRWEILNSVDSILDETSVENSQSRIQEILKIGSSSGFDLLQGIIFGIQISL